MKRKTVAAILSLALGAMLTAGCGSGSNSSSSASGTGSASTAESSTESASASPSTAAESTSTASESTSTSAETSSASATSDYDVENREYKDVTITVMTKMDQQNESGKWFVEMVDQFQKDYPGITIDNVMIPTEADYLDAESVAMSSPSSIPNVFEDYGGSRLVDYLEADQVVDLKPYLDADAEWSGGFNNIGWEMTDFSRYGYEGTYGIPQNGYLISLFYNEDILNANGIDPSTIKSWDDLMEACKTLLANGVQPFELGEKDNYRFGHLHSVLNYKTYGTDIAYQLGDDEVSYDDEKELAIYQMIIDAYNAGYLGTNLLGNDDGTEDALFNSGKTAFLFSGSWYCSISAGGDNELYNNEKVHALAFPYVNEEYATCEMGGGNQCYYVGNTGDADELAASVLFMKYLTSVDNVNKLVERYPSITSVTPTVKMDNYLLEEVNEIISNSTSMLGDIENYDTEQHMINTVRNALQGICTGYTAEDVGKNIVETSETYEQ